MSELVSIIIPIYNSEPYLKDTITSIVQQSHKHWELILVNDGSTDRSKEVALSFDDPRIRYYEQKNQGVSSARNIGLSHMSGDFFCFLDSDDMLTPQSLLSRLAIFRQHKEVGFVDGVVKTYDAKLKECQGQWKPQFYGEPLEELLKLSDKCFFGITWMIKYEKGMLLEFDKTLKIGEDLLFYIEYAQKSPCLYYSTDETVYKRRSTPGSASSSLSKLAQGYHELLALLINKKHLDDPKKIAFFKSKIRSIILKSSLRHLDCCTFFKELTGRFNSGL